jgi:uncharacterized protein with HEPN domain
MLEDWLEDLVEMAEKIVAHTDRLSFEEFRVSEPHRDLVQKKIENMGEAARYLRVLHPDYHAGVSDVPWRKLTETRNRLTHGYFDVSPAILWDTAKRDVPPLLVMFRALLEERRAVRE